jgi:hypothetical protein
VVRRNQLRSAGVRAILGLAGVALMLACPSRPALASDGSAWYPTLGPRLGWRFADDGGFEVGGEASLWYLSDIPFGANVGATSSRLYAELQAAFVGEGHPPLFIPGVSVGGFRAWHGGHGVTATVWACSVLTGLVPFVGADFSQPEGLIVSLGVMVKLPIGLMFRAR